MLPVVRTLQKYWPNTELTWVIGKLEAKLIGDIPGISFVIFDKSAGWLEYLKLYKKISPQKFDIILHLQTSMRANLISLLISGNICLGFDRARAKDWQWIFTNHQIIKQSRQHVLDSFFGFIETLGIQKRLLNWDIPIPDCADAVANKYLPGDEEILMISPCANARFRNFRNWTIEGYAAVAEYAVTRHKMKIVLTGGPTSEERRYGEGISQQARCEVLNLIGKTTLKELLAILKKATVLISPDSGPAHMATAVGTPVIGLYATTNPDRARPYLSAEWVVSKYPEAVRMVYGKEVSEMPWGTRARQEDMMALITKEAVIKKLDQLLEKLSLSNSNEDVQKIGSV
ncbi:MAG: glycosyltransferase family 9 protein [Nitrospiria bacterium]